MQMGSGGVFTLRSLQRLEAQIKAATDLYVRLVLFAKKAGYLAKMAEIKQANEIVRLLRERNSGYDPQLSAWVMYAEGLILHFETLDNRRTKDKFLRAFLVAQMAGDRELAANAAAWVANCELTAGQIKDAAGHLQQAFEWSAPNDSDARGRASMVLADGLNLAGCVQDARRWYKVARQHAVTDGDIAMQNVMLYNAAAYSVSHLTLADCFQTVDPSELERATLEVASACNLNGALGITHLQSLMPIMQAELLVVKRAWQEAADLIDQNIDALVRDGQQRLQPRLLAQRAWCRVNTGEIASASADVAGATTLIDDCADLDDLAVLHFRLATTLDAIGDSTSAQVHLKSARDCLNLFQEQQSNIRSTLSDVIAQVTPKQNDPADAGSDSVS